MDVFNTTESRILKRVRFMSKRKARAAVLSTTVFMSPPPWCLHRAVLSKYLWKDGPPDHSARRAGRGAQPLLLSQGRETCVALPSSDRAWPLMEPVCRSLNSGLRPHSSCMGLWPGREHFLNAAWGRRAADRRGGCGEEGEEKCLSQHTPLPRRFQGSCLRPECGSRQRLQGL